MPQISSGLYILIDALLHGFTPLERKEAALKLARVPPEEREKAMEALLTSASQDEDKSVRFTSRKVLAFLKISEEIGAARNRLNTPNEILLAIRGTNTAKKIEAIRLATENGMKEMLPAIRDELKKSRSNVEIATLVKALGKLGGQKCIPELLPFLKHPDPRVRANAIEGIGDIPSVTVLREMITLLDDPDNRVVANALAVMQKYRGILYRKAFFELVDSPRIADRASAIYLLERLPFEDSFPRLIKFLEDDAAEIRMAAVKALGRTGDERALQPLIEWLDRATTEERPEGISAIETLTGRLNMENRNNLIETLRKKYNIQKENPAVNSSPARTGVFSYFLSGLLPARSSSSSTTRELKNRTEKKAETREEADSQEIQELESQLEEHLSDWSFYELLLARYEKTSDLPRFIKEHEDRLRVRPAPSSLAMLYLLYMKLGEKREALKCLEEFTALTRNDREAFCRLAQLQESLSLYDAAKKSYEMALSISSDPAVRLKYAVVLYRLKLMDDFLKVIELTLKQPHIEKEIATQALDILWQAYCEETGVKDRLHFKNVLAIAYYRSEISDRAEELFLDILKSESSPGDIATYLWNIYSLRQDYDKAARLFRALFNARNQDLVVFEYYVRALVKTGHAPEALTIIMEQRKKGLDRFSLFKLGALIEEVLEEMIKGDNMSNSLLALEFLRATPVCKLKNPFLVAEILVRNGQFSPAIKAYEDAFLLSPTDSETTRTISRRIKYFEKLRAEFERKYQTASENSEDFVDMIIDGILYRIPVSDKAREKVNSGKSPWLAELEIIEDELTGMLKAGSLKCGSGDTAPSGKASSKASLAKKLERFASRCPGNLRFKAQFLLVRFHFETGNAVKALNVIDTIALEPLNDENIEQRYEIGDLLEKHEQYVHALEIFEQIRNYSYEYGDITRRIRHLRNLLDRSRTVCVKTDELTFAGRFRVKKKLGEGGMNIVYLALDKNTGMEFALKVPKEQYHTSQDFLKRFRQEASVLLQLEHPNIVRVHEISDSIPPFIVMEFLEGRSLRDILLESSPLPPATVIDYVTAIARALEYAHSRHVIHRDVKPENIFVTRNGNVKLMDFGIAKAMDALFFTATGEIMGTAAYMSPEQCMGLELDCRTDIYSLGVTFYELACGKKPFEGGDVSYQHIHVKPELPSKRNPSLPHEFDRIIMKCLEKEPARRYPNVSILLAELIPLRDTVR